MTLWGWMALVLLLAALPAMLEAPLSVCHAGVFQNKLHRAMEVYINLDKEILLRNELLGKIEKETIQAEEVRGQSSVALLMHASFRLQGSLSTETPEKEPRPQKST